MYNFYIADLEPGKNGISNVDWALHDKKDASWGNHKHEPIFDSIFTI